jgi:hypothetical protein
MITLKLTQEEINLIADAVSNYRINLLDDSETVGLNDEFQNDELALTASVLKKLRGSGE